MYEDYYLGRIIMPLFLAGSDYKKTHSHTLVGSFILFRKLATVLE